MSTSNDLKWVVCNYANGVFMSHPRGGWTTDWKSAYCWHYKRDASAEGRGECYRVVRLRDAKIALGL